MIQWNHTQTQLRQLSLINRTIIIAKMETSLRLLYSGGLILAFLGMGFSYQRRDEKISFCVESSSSETIRTFWLETADRCSKDPKKLIEFYQQMSEVKLEGQDKCNSLLLSHVRKAIIEEVVEVFGNAIYTDNFNFRKNLAIDDIARKLFQCDKKLSEAVFEHVIDAVYLHVDKSELAASLYGNSNFEQMVTSLLYLHWKYTTRNDIDTRLPILMANYMHLIRKNVSFHHLPRELKVRIERVILSLPQMLNLLYFNTGGRLINTGVWEYFYAPREIGESDQMRNALTWSKYKNESDSDMILCFQVRDNGDIAFLALYDGMWKLLVPENQSQIAIFWLDIPTRALNELKWWKVHWYEDDFLLQNALTKQFLCATKAYDENRRYVTMHSDANAVVKIDGKNPCYWAVRPLNLTRPGETRGEHATLKEVNHFVMCRFN